MWVMLCSNFTVKFFNGVLVDTGLARFCLLVIGTSECKLVDFCSVNPQNSECVSGSSSSDCTKFELALGGFAWSQEQ